MRLRTAAFILILVLGILTLPLSGEAQKGKVYRIGWLWGGQFSPQVLKIVQDELRKHGWIEGQNIMFEHRVAEGLNDRLPQFAAELVRLDVSVILTSQSASTLAAKEATKTIPIVMVGSGDPVRYGLVTNLARPEANVTGVSFLVNEMAVKLVELLKEANPQLSYLAIFINPTNPGAAPYAEAAQAAARLIGVKTLVVQVKKPDDFEAAFDSILREKADTLLLPPEGLIVSQRKRILDFAVRHRLVVGGNSRAFVDAGALVSYTAQWWVIFRRVGDYVNKILRGAKPADLPVEQPMKFELVINMKTAKALGLTIPPSVLMRSDRIIE
jgi:putative ABC transport system substrate-binding protein